jgi:thioredoxin 1
MKPILEQLAVEYEGKLNVVIVEVYEQMELTRFNRIMAIPTQIVFDSSGKEITRHVGLWPKEQIIAQLKKMGIE